MHSRRVKPAPTFFLPGDNSLEQLWQYWLFSGLCWLEWIPFPRKYGWFVVLVTSLFRIDCSSCIGCNRVLYDTYNPEPDLSILYLSPFKRSCIVLHNTHKRSSIAMHITIHIEKSFTSLLLLISRNLSFLSRSLNGELHSFLLREIVASFRSLFDQFVHYANVLLCNSHAPLTSLSFLPSHSRRHLALSPVDRSAHYRNYFGLIWSVNDHSSTQHLSLDLSTHCRSSLSKHSVAPSASFHSRYCFVWILLSFFFVNQKLQTITKREIQSVYSWTRCLCLFIMIYCTSSVTVSLCILSLFLFIAFTTRKLRWDHV